MYEAPDRYKRMIAARLPDGESLGVTSREPDDGSSPLRDAQLIARGEFAPFFAAANSVAAVLMAMVLFGHVATSYLVGWATAVVATNLGFMQLARTQAVTHVGRSGRKVPKVLMVGDIVARALIWMSLPVLSFPTLGAESQVVAATLIAGLGIGALGLVVVPTCVTAWMAIFTAGLSYSLLVGRSNVPFDNMVAILFTLGVFGIFLNRKNIIIILMSIELILLAVNLNFVAFSAQLGDLAGQAFALLILTVAAAEAAIGLAILVIFYRNRGTIAVEDVNMMKG